MYGEYYYSEGGYGGDALTEEELPEFLDDWDRVECETDADWTEVEC